MTPSDHRPFLSIVTVTASDPEGLRRTLRSVVPHLSDDVEQIVIDGGDPDPQWEVDGPTQFGWVVYRCERDAGIYDAMNKGLALAGGSYVLFLNGGDELAREFSLDAVRAAGASARVLLGYSVEQWDGDEFLRPGLRRERDVLAMPAHQATFYPRSFYARERYDLRFRTGADGVYTGRAVEAAGATFVPVIVCRFSLGGRSTSYGDLRTLRSRMSETGVQGSVGLLTKAVLWRLLPRRSFYRLMARGKFTRLNGTEKLRLQGRSIDLTTARIV